MQQNDREAARLNASEPVGQRKTLSPEAQRALAEAEERRKLREAEAQKVKREKELGGREGPDPVRYGDWENGGIASDF
ncbi:MAG: DUF1674 domain-containing protein [Hyphomicrobiaceae bacterium]